MHLSLLYVFCDVSEVPFRRCYESLSQIGFTPSFHTLIYTHGVCEVVMENKGREIERRGRLTNKEGRTYLNFIPNTLSRWIPDLSHSHPIEYLSIKIDLGIARGISSYLRNWRSRVQTKMGFSWYLTYTKIISILFIFRFSKTCN